MIPYQFVPSLGQESFLFSSLNCMFFVCFVDNNNNRWESHITSFMEMSEASRAGCVCLDLRASEIG